MHSQARNSDMREPEKTDASDTRPADPDHPDAVREAGDGLDFPFDRRPGPGETIAVARGLHWLRMPLPWSLDHINLYALEDDGGWTLVDSGVRSGEIKGCWDSLFAGPLAGGPVRRILVTHHHPDHIGLAAWLAARFDAPIHATRAAWLLARTLSLDVADEPPEEVISFMRRAGLPEKTIEAQRRAGWGNFAKLVERLPVGYRRIEGGDRLTIGGETWRVLETGGHAPGHACLFSESRHILISGDQVLPRISSNVSVYPTEPGGNPLEEWLEGLARMRALPEKSFVLPAHNTPFTGLHARLEALIGKHVGRMGDLAAMCAAPKAATEVFPALFLRAISREGYTMATGEALAHLHFLEAEGVLERVAGEDGIDRFRQASAYDEASLRARLDRITHDATERGPWTAA